MTLRNIAPGKLHDQFLVPYVKRQRIPTSSDRINPDTGRTYVRPFLWIVGPNPSSGSEGDLYYLASINSGNADWQLLATGTLGGGNLLMLAGDSGTDVDADAGGSISITGSTVANATNAKPLYIDDTTANALIAEIQVASAVTGAPADKNDAGLVSFDDTAFAVDANGYVTVVGGGTTPALISLNVDNATSPGTDPVVANGSAQITVSGAAVAAHSVPVDIHSRAANTANVEVQVASDRTGAPGNKNDAGLVSFDDVSFTTDADGYTTLNTVGVTKGGTGLTTLTTGDIYYASASNTLAKLPIGSEDEILSVSASGIPEWVATPLPGGGDWTLITTITTSSGSSYTDTSSFGTAYEEYMLILDGISGHSGDLNIGFSIDAGSNYNVAIMGSVMEPVDQVTKVDTTSGYDVTPGPTHDFYGWIHWTHNKRSTIKPLSIVGSDGNEIALFGSLNTTSDIDGFSISTGLGTFAGGSITIWGK